MEAIIYQQNIDPLPIEKNKTEFIKPEGILNSEYKRTAIKTLSVSDRESIHQIRKEVRRRQFTLVSEIDTSFSVPIVIYLNSILKMCQEGQFFYCPCCWAEVFSVILPR